LAVCLLELRGFSSNDFAKYHPGGALGKKLYLRVNDLSSMNEKPHVHKNTVIKDVIIEITKKMLGVTAVIENDKIIGIITDGDLRRMLSKSDDITTLTAQDVMSLNPKCIDSNAMAVDALELMEQHDISQLLVEENGKYAGVVHLHDLIKEGII
ncbi:MAG: CBS domain-containing protein, partial [Bacteroidia bacterium]|nr:CBS domain-containing protein [Bacteroidia bacterium]